MYISLFDQHWPIWDIIRRIENTAYTEICKIDNWSYEAKQLIGVKKYKTLSSGTLKIGDRWDENLTYCLTNEFALSDELIAEFRLPQKPLHFIFDTQGEGEVYVNDFPVGSIDHEHSFVLLTDDAQKPGKYKINIEITKHIHDAAKHERLNNKPYPHAVLANAAVLYIDEEILKFAYLCQFLLEVVFTMDASKPDDLKIKNHVRNVLETNLFGISFDREDLLTTKEKILDEIKEIKDVKNYGKAYYTGHSHLDLVFKWTWKETVRKIERTLSNTNTLLKTYKSPIYTQSQMQIFESLKDYYPELFEECKKHIQANRIEVMGSTWSEFDANLTAAESIIRQIALGRAFSRENFGIESDILFLPDCFGYNSILPQILKQTDYKYFTTAKLYWNETNPFPYNVFNWEGLDGSQISALSLCAGYSSSLEFDSIHGAKWNLQQKEISVLPMMYGASDGGGGMSAQMILKKEAMQEADILFELKDATFSQTVEDMSAEIKDKPVYKGEIYLEKHRGTFTSQAKIKKNNRFTEQALYNAEALATELYANGAAYPAKELESAWKTLCLNQFHDILPGSCINEAKKDNWEQMGALASTLNSTVSTLLHASTDSDNFVLYNQLPFGREIKYELPLEADKQYVLYDNDTQIPSTLYYDYNSQLVQCFTTYIDGLSTKNIKFVLAPLDDVQIAVDYKLDAPFEFENENYKVVFDNTDGHIIKIKKDGKLLLENANKLIAYHDKGGYFNAWDINKRHMEFPVDTRLIQASKISSDTVRIKLQILNSFITQDITFDKTIRFKTKTNFNDSELLLKTFFCTGSSSQKGYYDTSAGYIERSSLAEDIKKSTKYEVCMHKWMANEPTSGVAVLNDCKYGGNIVEGTMHLTLLKTGVFPDPVQDLDETECNYYLYFYEKGLSDVNREACCINATPNIYLAPAIELQPLFKLDNPNIFAQSIKKSDYDDAVILRIINYSDKDQLVNIDTSLDYKKIAEVSPLEKHWKDLDDMQNIILHKFEIKTFKLY